MSTSTTSGLPLDLLIRTSQRKEDAESPAQQRQQADRVCKQGAHRIVYVHDSGGSESGKTMERAALRLIRERVRQGLTAGVVVGYLDRLGRAPIEESMTFVRELVGDGGKLVAADWDAQPIDLADPNVEDMLVFRLQMNRSQWNKAAERYRLSQRNAVAAGKFIGPTPFGFIRREKRLVEHPTFGPIVRRAYRIAALDGLAAAVEYLQKHAPVRPAAGKRHEAREPWNTSSVRRLLESRVYLGESWVWLAKGVDLQTVREMYPDVELQPVEDGRTRMVNVHAHTALADPDDFTAALSNGTARPRRSNGEYVLSGFVTCGECGAPLVGQLQAVGGRQYRRMRCGACARCSISADGLELYVRDWLAAQLADASFRLQFVPGDLDAARVAVAGAKTELRAFSDKVPATSPVFLSGYELRHHALSVAQVAYDEIVAQTAISERLPSAHELDNPKRVELALSIVTAAGVEIVIRAGRGPIADVSDGGRVSILPLDRDDRAGMLAA
jgi:DNA invertase Pin-like site-specific DNA recombinase